MRFLENQKRKIEGDANKMEKAISQLNKAYSRTNLKKEQELQEKTIQIEALNKRREEKRKKVQDEYEENQKLMRYAS